MTKEDRHNIGLVTSICKCCGLVQCNPRCDDEWYNQFYRDQFWKLYIGKDESNLEDLYLKDHQDYKGSRIGEKVMNVAGRRMQVKDYLDIGCGLGGVVKYLADTYEDLNISAVEPSDDAVDFVSSRVKGITIHHQSIEQLDELESASFDVISMVHVLEHVQDPLVTLRSIRRLLRETGVAYIEVPEFLNRNWTGKNYLHIAHRYIFDKDVISRACGIAGLEVVEFCDSPVPDIWPWAFGAFVRRSNVTASSWETVSEKEIQNKIAFMENRLSASGLWLRGKRVLARISRKLH